MVEADVLWCITVAADGNLSTYCVPYVTLFMTIVLDGCYMNVTPGPALTPAKSAEMPVFDGATRVPDKGKFCACTETSF